MEKPKKIPISRLGELLFCEYKLYLRHHKKIKEKPTIQMIKGKVAHDKLHKDNKVKREVIKEAKKIYKDRINEIKSKTIPTYAKKKLIRSLEKPPDDNIRREFSVVGGRLRGRIDEIIFNDNSVMIIDDKPHDKAYDTDKIQVWGYCYAYMQRVI